jgi:hypothetical protein
MSVCEHSVCGKSNILGAPKLAMWFGHQSLLDRSTLLQAIMCVCFFYGLRYVMGR